MFNGASIKIMEIKPTLGHEVQFKSFLVLEVGIKPFLGHEVEIKHPSPTREDHEVEIKPSLRHEV